MDKVHVQGDYDLIIRNPESVRKEY